MRQFHPGLLSIIELYFKNVDAFLAEDITPIASEEVWPLPSGLACRGADPRRPIGELQAISLAAIVRAGPARRARFH